MTSFQALCKHKKDVCLYFSFNIAICNKLTPISYLPAKRSGFLYEASEQAWKRCTTGGMPQKGYEIYELPIRR